MYHKDERYSSYPIDFNLSILEYLYETIDEHLDVNKYDEIKKFIKNLEKEVIKLALYKNIQEIKKCYALEISKYIRSLVIKEQAHIEAFVYEFCYEHFDIEYERIKLGDSRLNF